MTEINGEFQGKGGRKVAGRWLFYKGLGGKIIL
jgi:hypothetical protein